MTWLVLIFGLLGGALLHRIFGPSIMVRRDPLDVPMASCGRCGDIVSAYCKDHRAEHAAAAISKWTS